MGKFVSSDGRAFTDYRPNCLVNKNIQKNMNSLEYRKYLQTNASKIMEDNLKYSIQTNKEVCNCSECVELTKRKL